MVLLLVLLLLPDAGAQGRKQRKWKTYQDCVFLSDKHYDGDSFHVKHKKKHIIVRLCFVDTPETDTSVQERLLEQADYWGVSVKQVMDAADQAKAFAKEFLKDGFTVHTQGVDARGRSQRKRIYGMVSVRDRFLCEALVERGLARVYGFAPNLPDGVPGSAYMELLREIEKQAKVAGRGVWGSAPDAPPSEIVLKRNTAVYTVGPFPSVARILKPGEKLAIRGDHSAFMIKVGYMSNGEMKEGLCKRSDVGIWPAKKK